jgi:hypothetical protein
MRSFSHNRDIDLPPRLNAAQVRRAVDYMEHELADLATIAAGNPRGFASVVRNFGVKALAKYAGYEKVRYAHTTQQRFPDLRRRGAGPKPSPNESLESKASKRPWAIQSHYDHPGWYIVWRYLVDPTETLERGKPVVIWRVDVAFLEKSDWKYEKSSASAGGGGRTHTFGVKNVAAKLRDKAVYHRKDVVIRNGKPIPR